VGNLPQGIATMVDIAAESAMTSKDEMHVLRNPHGFSEDVVRASRLWAADEIERLDTLHHETALSLDTMTAERDRLQAALERISAIGNGHPGRDPNALVSEAIDIADLALDPNCTLETGK
jgi:hypothetical protein